MPITRDDVNKRSVRIRITGEGDLPTIVAGEIVNAVNLIRANAINWSGKVPTEADPNINHVYLTLVNKDGFHD